MGRWVKKQRITEDILEKVLEKGINPKHASEILSSYGLEKVGLRYGTVSISGIVLDTEMDPGEAGKKVRAGEALPIVLASADDGYRVVTGIERVVVAKSENQKTVEALILPIGVSKNLESLREAFVKLFSSAFHQQEVTGGTSNIPLERVIVKEQIRKDIDPESLKELAESMERVGLINPITVRKEGDRYVLVAGHRRFLAARDILKWENIPARVLEESKDTVFVQFTENVHRKNLNPVEVAEVVGRALLEELGWAGKSISQIENMADKSLIDNQKPKNIFTSANIRDRLAEKEFFRKHDRLNEKEKAATARIMKDYGISANAISVALYLYSLPEEIKSELAKLDLRQTHYYSMLERGIYDPEQILALARVVHEKGMTVAELKSLISRLKAEKEQRAKKATAEERFYSRLQSFIKNVRRSRILKKNPELRQKLKEQLLQLIEELEKEE